MRVWASLLLCSLLAACAAPQINTAPPEALFQNHLFAASTERIRAEDVFALSDSMRRYLQTEMAGQLRYKDRQSALIDALYRKGELKIEYDAAITRNASEAFDARAGNCLSLVIMTGAFAKELGLPVQYRSAYLEEVWSRSNNLLLRSGHVNVTIGHRLADAGTNPLLSPLTIDFLPPEEISGLRTREIAEQTVISMYMNNRAAERLAEGRLDDAYSWARAAIRQSPGFVSPYNTLGVIYLRHGDLAQAALVFGHVLEREPENTRAMANLAEVFSRQRRTAESAALRHKLAQLEPEPPFHYFNLGVAAMKKDDFESARALFAKEVARADYNPEFHFWLGLANFRLGQIELARKHLSRAMEHSATRGDRELYAAKLAWLRSYGRR